MTSETFIDDFFAIFDDSLSTQYLYYMIFRLNNQTTECTSDVSRQKASSSVVNATLLKTFNYIFINWMLINCICQMYVKKVT